MFSTSTPRRIAVAAICAVAVSGPAMATNVITDTFSSFLVFGDSLSDNGNLFAVTSGGAPESPPYFNGRFSNGPVWNEQIIESFSGLGRLGENFAFGGAQATTDADFVPDFAAQVGLFQANVPAPALGDRPLASVWFGANDLFGTIPQALSFDTNGLPVFDNTPALNAAAAAALNIGLNIEQLNGTSGIEDIVVFNLPDLGQIPLFAGTPLAPFATEATDEFNTLLMTEILSLRADGINVIEVDINDIFNQLLADPEAFGVSDTTTTCVISDTTSTIVQNCLSGTPSEIAQGEADNDERVFFDTVHPTQQIHAQLTSEFTAAVVAAVPLPAPAFLLLGALGLLAMNRRKLKAA